MVILKQSGSYIRKLIEERTRIDGRALDAFRPIELETGVIKNAEGSCRVKIGATELIAGIKMDVHTPYPDTPNEGLLVVDCELVPLAAPEFEPGPPSPEAVEIARVVDRGIRESGAIDMAALCITPGELAWTVHIDIHVLNHDGNLLDAASIAAIAALLTTRMPRYEPEHKRVVREPSGRLPLRDRPVAVTIGKISNVLLLDTSGEEETVLDARVTFAINQAGNICAIQKGGRGWFTTAELLTAVDTAIATAERLRALLPVL